MLCDKAREQVYVTVKFAYNRCKAFQKITFFNSNSHACI